MQKFTVKDFNSIFPDDDSCLHSIFKNRYGHLSECPSCGKKFSYYKVSNRKCYACAYCGHQLHPTADTIFHKSATSLYNWFYAIFLFANSKNGVSAKELERQLGVTYKTAWRMAKQIRILFQENISLLENTVEIDETYIGGKESNKHSNKKTKNTQGRSTKTKTPVIGAVEREGKIIAKVICDTKTSNLMPFIRENVHFKANIHTDEYHPYKPLKYFGYNHSIIKHGEKQYVKDTIHTNTIEGFWSQLKRSIHGTYHYVSTKYLQSYLNEFTFRYNRRESNTPIFHSITKLAYLPV